MTVRRSLFATVLLTIAVALVLVAVEALEGDFTDVFSDLVDIAQTNVSRIGPPGAVGLLYLEESGVPLPIPGDVWVVYLGTQTIGSLGATFAAWLAIVVFVVAGASNLYLISRHYGTRLIEHRFARYLHLDPKHLARAEGWLRRWGPVTVIFGRHIPGFRIPITVMAGIFRLPYRVFAPSVAVSSAIWAGVWFYLAHIYGQAAVHLLTGKTIFVVAAVVIAVVAAIVGVRIWSRAGAPSADRPERTIPKDERVTRP